MRDSVYIFGGTVDNNIRSGEMYRFQLAAFPKCTLQEDYGKLLASKQFCDVTFLVGPKEEEVPAHAALVVARSAWLRDRIKEAKSRRKGDDADEMLTVSLAEADPRAFRMVLDYIYTDQIDPTGDNRDLADSNMAVLAIMEVYTLAVTFHMSRLEQLCARYIETSINAKNVLEALSNAARLRLLFVKEYCQRFITKEQNYNQIVMSKEFETLDRPLMVEIIRQRTCPTNPAPTSSSSPALRGGATSPIVGISGGSGGGSGDGTDGHTLRDDMRRFLLSDDGAEFADVRLSLGEDVSESFPAHRAVLAARSSYFEGKFRSFGPTAEDDNTVPIAIGEMVPSAQSFRSLLRYVYYGDVTMPPEDSLYLFSAPLFYIFSNHRLQAFCKHNLERNVTVENVVQILEAADRSQVMTAFYQISIAIAM